MQSTLSPLTSASSLAARINASHEACCRATGQALEHAMLCGELLAEAKADCEHGQWRLWLRDNFIGSQRTAQVYMRLAANRDAIESKAQRPAHLSVDGAMRLLATPRAVEKQPGLIEQIEELFTVDPTLTPPNGGSLIFSREFSDGSKRIVIAPSVHPGYYYVSMIDLTCGELGGGFVEGTKRPVPEKYLRFTIEGLKAMSLVEKGERHEVPFTEPQTYNHYVAIERAEKQLAEMGV